MVCSVLSRYCTQLFCHASDRQRFAPSKSPSFHLPGGAGSLLSHPALIVGLFGVAVILLLFAILLGIFIIYKIKRGHDEGILSTLYSILKAINF